MAKAGATAAVATTTGVTGASSSSTTAAYTAHTSISPIIDKYDGFILDQYGVMHDGSKARPGALDCVRHLACTKKKKLIILSNTSSPSSYALERLPNLGYDPKWFESGAVTSGDGASSYIRQTYGKSGKKKALVFTFAGSRVMRFLDQCGGSDVVEIARSIDEADFILTHGSEVVLNGPGSIISSSATTDSVEYDLTSVAQSLGFRRGEDYTKIDSILKPSVEKGLPMICGNPDMIVISSDGTVEHMPGKIAQRFEEMGGLVHYFGKPNASAFEACLSKLNLPRHKVAHIGDSLHHDVMGANGIGIDSIFVSSGIHVKDLHGDNYELGESVATKESLDSLFQKVGTTPTHVIPLLRL